MKIFILMYNFPPIGAGRGIAWTYFSEKMAQEHDVTVFTINPSENDPLYNAQKLEMISEDYRVIRSFGGKIYEKLYSKEKSKLDDSQSTISRKSVLKKFSKKIYKHLLKVVIFPDRMVFWNKYLKRSVNHFAETEGSPDIIISVGFPFSTHLLAQKLKEKFNCKLILDYGDPWSFNPSNETIPNRRRKIDACFEKTILQHADYVTVTTTSTRDEYIRRFPVVREKIDVISQGVDTKIYHNKKEKKSNTNIINFFYSGLFYEDIRNPNSFIDAMEELSSEKLFGKKIVISIAGKMEQSVIERISSFSNKSVSFHLLGNIGFNEVVDYQINTDVLLFFGNLGSLQVPGKLFEYLTTDRPIFAICDKSDFSGDTIKHYNKGVVSTYESEDILKTFNNFIKCYSEGIYNKTKRVNDYDWDILAEKYLKIINQI